MSHGTRDFTANADQYAEFRTVLFTLTWDLATYKKENELRERIPVPYDNYFKSFKVRARTAKVIFVCCFRDPRGLLKRESWHVSPPNIESSTYVRTWSCQYVELLPNDLRGCPQENHAKPCRRCYRLDHRTGLFSVCTVYLDALFSNMVWLGSKFLSFAYTRGRLFLLWQL